MRSKKRRAGGGIRRHLEGWQAGAVAVAIALIGLSLGMRRPVPPNMLVLPQIEPRALARIEGEEAALADAALSQELPYEVRAAGEAFRHYGAAVTKGDTGAALEAEKELRGLLRTSRDKYGDDAVLKLRAVQTRLFLEALTRFEQSGKPDAALEELAGNFAHKARRAHWLDEHGRLSATRAERETLFRIRWTEIADLRHERAFAPALAEWQTYYRFLLQHPGPGGADEQLRVVTALERVDPSYPAMLSRGVLLFRMGHFQASEQAFRAFLGRHPSGPWRLRAMNYLAAAVQEVKARQTP